MIDYELVLVFPGSYQKEDLNKLSDKIKKIIVDASGKLKKETEWGNKHLAYPVKHENTGVYFFWEVSFPQATLKEFRRLMNFETKLLRYLMLKINK